MAGSTRSKRSAVRADEGEADHASSSSAPPPQSKRLKQEEESENNITDPAAEASFHRALVEAIFELGLTHSSPGVIMDGMAHSHEAITSERVKSKLQKYRNNKDKSQVEFMEEYDTFLARVQALGSRASPDDIRAMLAQGDMNNDGDGNSPLLGGDAAAYLSYMALNGQGAMNNNNNNNVEFGGGGDSSTVFSAASGGASSAGGFNNNKNRMMMPPPAHRNFQIEAQQFLRNFDGRGLAFPRLTEDEKKSPLGVSMVYVMGLFMQMKQLIEAERAAKLQPQQQQQQLQSNSTGAPYMMPTTQDFIRSMPPFNNNTSHGPSGGAAQAADEQQPPHMNIPEAATEGMHLKQEDE